MRHFAFRPALTLRGRRFKGPRGFAGKPLHPPLTDVPIAAYLLAAGFDVLSLLVHASHRELSTELYRAATWVMLCGAAVSVLTALSGAADWWRSSEPGTQARRTVNAHALLMISATVLVVVDLVLRGLVDGERHHPSLLVTALSLAIAVLIVVGATLGGSLVYDYGFNVETAGDSPVWHPSETDLLPGQKAAPPQGVPAQAPAARKPLLPS
jgi:uncharacterized membrane protein